MAMKYVKVFYDWYEMTEALNDEEYGSLIRGLQKYAQHGELTELKGLAAALFPVFKTFVDREGEAYDKKVAQCKEAGRKGGKSKQTLTDVSERKRTLANANETSEEQEKEKEQEQEKDQDQEQEQDQENIALGDALSRTHKENGERPTLEEVEAFAGERGRSREYAEKFYDHYSAVGWRMGRSPIIDWQAAFRTWEKTEPDAQPCQREKDNKDKAQSGGDESYGSIDDYDEFFRLALKRSYGDDFQF